jgi:hypothetical protein
MVSQHNEGSRELWVLIILPAEGEFHSKLKSQCYIYVFQENFLFFLKFKN